DDVVEGDKTLLDDAHEGRDGHGFRDRGEREERVLIDRCAGLGFTGLMECDELSPVLDGDGCAPDRAIFHPAIDLPCDVLKLHVSLLRSRGIVRPIVARPRALCTPSHIAPVRANLAYHCG